MATACTRNASAYVSTPASYGVTPGGYGKAVTIVYTKQREKTTVLLRIVYSLSVVFFLLAMVETGYCAKESKQKQSSTSFTEKQKALEAEVVKLTQARKFDEAIPLAKRSLSARERRLGQEFNRIPRISLKSPFISAS